MIIARIDGGLGNQMFQYAYGLYLSERNQTHLVLDTSAYQAAPQHGYLLDHFEIEAGLAGIEHQPRIPSKYRGDTQRPSLWASLGCRPLNRHKEAIFGFHAKHLSVPDNRYLVGYWQSEKFFPGMRETLLEHFSLRQPMTRASQDVANRMRGTNSVAIHVRRGDYLTNPDAAQLYESVGIKYYRSALNDFTSSHACPSDLEVFVFSNDIDWCRANMNLPWKTHWVDHNTGATAHEDMFLMSLAACCIIANSTFSWWAAWLNCRPEKVVYAPPAWFRSGTKDDSNILCDDWNTLPTEVRRLTEIGIPENHEIARQTSTLEC